MPPPEAKTPKPPGKPRKSRYETQEQYERRFLEWQALIPNAEIQVQPKGNSMTQLYYTENILPHYLETIKQAQEAQGRAILQEDNDPSHGTRSQFNLTRKYKNDNNIELLIHPAESPDLNPMEACWNILKQRVRRHRWDNLDQLKELLVQEWEAITMDEIRTCIAEMPDRCDRLVERGGKMIKSGLW